MKYLSLLVFLFIVLLSFSQNTHQPRLQNMPADGIVTGYVIDKQTNKPIEYANIVIYSKRDSSIVTGGITDRTGFFRIQEVRYGRFFVDVMFIGYGKTTIEDLIIKPDKKEIDLGKIYLSLNAEVLSEVVVSENVNNVEYKLDRKVVNVNQDILSAGATAVEVLENVPSVTVDIDGNVSLRGSENFLVLVDGRPYPIQGSEALQQIPANSIESIEIITNPSAKYDPDGVAGIINVVLKKERRKGYNGQVSANYGTFNSFGTDFIFNFRRDKFNFFVGGSYNNRIHRGEGQTLRRTYLSLDTTFYLNNYSDNNRIFKSGNFRIGFDYFFNQQNILTLTGRGGLSGHGMGSNARVGSFYKSSNDIWDEYFYKTENFNNSSSYYYSGELNYTKKFKKAEHELQIFSSFSSDSEDEEDYYNKMETNYMWNPMDDTSQYRTIEKGLGYNTTAKVDYVLPLFENGKFEAGYQLRYKYSDRDYRYQNYLINSWIDDNTKYNPYLFTMNIQSGYLLFSNYFKKLGYQLGLRTEYTDREFYQKETTQSWTYTKFDFFPSLHLSYQFPNDYQILASYSRRLNRPMEWFLDPFVEVIDPNNVRQGNPLLKPEYTNSFDLSFQKKFAKNFVSLEAYARQTNNKISWITKIYPEDQSIFLLTFDNIGSDISVGTELMGNLNITDWYNLNISGNTYYYEIISDTYNSGSTFTYNARLNNTFRIKKSGTSFQLGGFYSGPSITAQGRINANYVVNAGLRQDFLDRKLSLSVNVRNVFVTMKRESINETPLFYVFSTRGPKVPFVNVSITYKINDFKPRKDRNLDDNERMTDEGI